MILNVAIALAWAAILVGGWLGWQMLRQNGRMVLWIEELEKRLDALEFDDNSLSGDGESQVEESQISNPESQTDQVASAGTGNVTDRNSRFNNRSLARSKIKRDG